MKRRPILTILGAFLVVLPSVAFPQYTNVQKVDIVRVSTPIAVAISTGGVMSVSGSTVTVTGYNVSNSTYVAFSTTSNGSRAVGFEVGGVSAVMKDGTGSGTLNINSGDNVPISGGVGYSWNSQGKRYVNPTVNFTVTVGTMVVVAEGYLP